MQALTIMVEDTVLADALRAALAAQGMPGFVVQSPLQDDAPADLYIAGADAVVPAGTVVLHPKLRMGTILDRLQKLSAGAAGSMLVIGPYHLRMADAVLRAQNGQGDDIRLTEKERDILVALHALGGGVMERRALLSHVWGYAAESETHTVETHIYRLRQKIEIDPADPQILLTEDNGYCLRMDPDTP